MSTSTDSPSAAGIPNIERAGDVGHIDIDQPWLHGKVGTCDIYMRKLNGEHNVADALTNHMDKRSI